MKCTDEKDKASLVLLLCPILYLADCFLCVSPLASRPHVSGCFPSHLSFAPLDVLLLIAAHL